MAMQQHVAKLIKSVTRVTEEGREKERIWRDGVVRIAKRVNVNMANRGNRGQHHWMALRMQGQFAGFPTTLL